jgi:hypothetical protein
MELLNALELTSVAKWIALVVGVLQLVLEWINKGDLSLPSIITIAAAVALFIINALQANKAKGLGLKRYLMK